MYIPPFPAIIKLYSPLGKVSKGEWLSPNTPGSRIPSHGTNRFGTRYAYDFIQVDWKRAGNPAYRVGFLHYLFSGVSLSDYYCWGQEIYSPCDGTVVAAKDGCAERPKTNLFSDMANAYRNAHYFDPAKDDERKMGKGEMRRANCQRQDQKKVGRGFPSTSSPILPSTSMLGAGKSRP